MARNAILLANHEAYRKADFIKIAAEIRRLAPDIRSYVAWKDCTAPRAQAAQLLRPSLTIKLCGSTRFWHLRGALAQSITVGKVESYRQMDAAGLPLPRWVELAPDTRLDPADWGRWVVLKPSAGYRGQDIRIARTEEVRYQAPDSYPPGHFGRQGPMLVQRYIHTGPWPSYYRVTTCFGRLLFCCRYEMKRELQPALADRDGFDDGVPRHVTASPQTADPRSFSSDGALADDPDVLELGRRVHAAHGDTPILGTDILRDATSGQLYVAEANQTNVWGLSGQRAEAWAARGLSGYDQFGAIRVAAEAMIDATRRLAR